MPKRSTVANTDGHEDVIKDFFAAFPANRDTYEAPDGYTWDTHIYHHSRRDRKYGGNHVYAPKVGGTWFGDKVIAKSQSKWHGTGGNYRVYTTMLCLIQEADND
tara:strand:- start:245 stop:556 length:312 start_codon:yes stop_codon:yes gene_type:complete